MEGKGLPLGSLDTRELRAEMRTLPEKPENQTGAGEVDFNCVTLENMKVEVEEEQHSVTWFLNDQQQSAFGNFVKNFLASRELLRKDANALRDAFGSIIYEAFDFLEDDRVVIFRSPKNQVIIKIVCDTTSRTYWIRPGVSQCPCIGMLGRAPFCKHVLAAHIQFATQSPDEYKEMGDELLLNHASLFEKELMKLPYF